MKLAWIFGSSMEARHLLYAYLSVWVIQGGYAGWIAWQWRREDRHSHPAFPPASQDTDLS